MGWTWPCVLLTCYLLFKPKILKSRYTNRPYQPNWRHPYSYKNCLTNKRKSLNYHQPMALSSKLCNHNQNHPSRLYQKSSNPFLKMTTSSNGCPNPRICPCSLLNTGYRRSIPINPLLSIFILHSQLQSYSLNNLMLNYINSWASRNNRA